MSGDLESAGFRDGPDEGGQGVPASSQRLGSWKEIAAYLNRDVRTVSRWEKSEGLPIHRHQHQKGASVYAFRSEIDDWWKAKRERLAGEASPAEVQQPISSRPRRHTVIWAAAAVVLMVTAAGLLLARSWKRTPSVPPGKIMVAVLPFENLTGDSSQEFVSDGFTEELITQISALQQERLGVIARTSSMSYKGTSKPVSQIGQELGVSYVVEGSVRRWADRVRVTAQLIDARTQGHVWAENYESDRRDILKLQNDVAEAIAGQVSLTVTAEDRSRSNQARAVDPQVYELWLLGRYEWNKRTESSEKKAIEYFQQAIARDPNYAPGHAGLAQAYFNLIYYSRGHQQELEQKAQAAAEKAFALDDHNVEALTTLAMIGSDEYRPSAEGQFRRALELNPNYATAHHWYAFHLQRNRQMERALQEIELARRLDPLSLIINSDRGALLRMMRQTDAAVAQLKHTLDLDPSFAESWEQLALTYAQQKRWPEAIAAAHKGVELDPNDTQWAALAYVEGLGGERESALQILHRMKSRTGSDAPPNYLLGWIYMGLGQRDEALTALEADAPQHLAVVRSVEFEPIYAPLRNEPRLQALMRRFNGN